MSSNTLTIQDLFGNTIEVTDLDAAISQAWDGSRVEKIYMNPFKLVDGLSQDIEGREDERVPVGTYWADALEKLESLKDK